MSAKAEIRRYLAFDPKSGYPGGHGIFYECTRCGEVVPSLPSDSVTCKCQNIFIDTDYGRVAISDERQLKVFTVATAGDK